MELTLPQKDALTELINIGYGRAAGALSELTGYRITLEVPHVSMLPLSEIGTVLEKELKRPVASVNQKFTGPVSGNALLLLDEASALVLSRLLTDNRTVFRDFDSNAREIITEVGNILLNACLGVFGNLLRIQITFSVPGLSIEDIAKVVGHAADQAAEESYGLMIRTRFHAKTEDVTGYLVILLSITSLDRLLQELKNWEERQLH